MSDRSEPPEILPRSALDRLVASSVDLLCIVDRQGALRWVNPAWERTLGWTEAELRQGGLSALVHPADLDDTEAVLEALQQGSGPRGGPGDEQARFECRLRRRDGSFCWLQWSVVPMQHGAIYGAARDITEQKLAEREAGERTRLLLMAEEVAGIGHWRIDLTRDALTWSREMYRIHGLDPETFEPDVERAVEAYHADDRGLVSDHIRDAILLGKDFEFELRIVRPDGSIRNVLSRGKCETSEDGRPLAVFGVFQDVTDRKRLQERVAHSERMATVGTLAAGVAHEINNPLTWVIANLDAMERALEDLGDRMPVAPEPGEPLAKILAEAQQGAEKVRRIVGDLLTYSRSRPQQLGRVAPTEALDIAINVATNQFKYRARLERAYGPVPAVMADQSRLVQVFVSLIVNAAQAIPERRRKEGLIEVRTGVDEDGQVRIDVVDNGLGMPPDVRARAFDPFYTTKPVGEGIGLGLSLAHRIIQAFQGRLELHSREGEGTRVTVILPPAPDDALVSLELDLPEPGLRIMLVDGEGRLGRTLARMLGPGVQLVTIHHGRDALSLLDDGEPFDAILCDADLTDMTALELVRGIQRVTPVLGESIGFVVGDDPDGLRGLLEAAGLACIPRPLDPATLRAVVERLTGG